MKKLTLILIALIAFAQTAWAQTWTEVGDKDALNTAVQTDGAHIKLTANIELENYLGIGDGDSFTPTITLDLNGHTLSRNLTSADGDGHVIWVRTGSTLYVQDNSSSGNGQLTGGWANNGGGICNYGTLYFQGGTITGCQTDYTGGAIRNNGTATISGGVITNCSAPYGGALYNIGTLTISGGTISNSSSTTGGGGGIVNIGTVEISGGTFSGNTANTDGGAIWNGNSGDVHGTLTITGGSITGNTATGCGGGIWNENVVTITNSTISNNTGNDSGGIYNKAGGDLTINSGTTISDNTSNAGGGGIVNYGTATISGGTISGNHAVSRGGGVWNGESASLTITGGTITGNWAETNGGGVFSYSNFCMSGNPNITGNENGNLYLDASSVINCGTFTSGASIGVSLANGKYNRAFTSGYNTNNNGVAPSTYFSADLNGATLSLSGNEAYISASGTIYVECNWTGGDTDGHVVKTQKLATGVSNYSDTEGLSAGWYLLSGSHTYEKRPACHGDVKFILQDGCDVEFKKGIHIDDGKTLTIYAQSGGTGKLKATGDDGSASNGDAAIGGNNEVIGGYLVIHGGDIYAYPYHNNAAGIGGGDGASGMRGITIWDGTIEAKGRSSGAGIGGGQQNDTHPTLKIYGGTVTATGGTFAAGIGGGEDRGNGPIYIYGGTVTATGGSSVSSNPFESGCGGAGIGGGEYGDQDNPIYIYGGTVTATGNGGNFGSAGSAGIGGGGEGDGGELYIYGGTVTATGYVFGAGIGGGYKGKGGTVYIAGGTVSATGSTFAAGIGGGYDGGSGTVTIDGGDVTVKGGEYGAGIGGSYAEDGGTITINGGTVTANGGSMGAGIGGGNKGYGGTITINGGTVTATSEEDGAGIGGGRVGEGGTITINGGTVTAYIGGYGGAGIGGGELSNGGTITINGGDVTATGGTEGGAGIGGGYGGCYGNGADVYIYGGKVTVEANGGGQAIGRGKESSVSEGTLTLGSTLSVKPESGSCVNSSSRVNTVRANGTYILQTCTHEGATYSQIDGNDGDYYHHIDCSYCEGENELHTKGDNDECTKCHKPLPQRTYTFYEANAAGTGYGDGTVYYVTETHEFTFPESGESPKYLVFAGWQESADEPESLVVDNTEGLIAAGSTTNVPALSSDRNYYARYTEVYFSGGEGTVSDPFLISNADDWNHLAQAVNDGITFSGMYFEMTNDISINTMAGQGSNRFRGTFDGQGHTLTVSYTGITEDYCAPFRHISGATIKNLNTAGTIETSGRYAAGVVAYTRYYSKIQNCRSSVVIRSSHEGWAGHGGILGLKADVSYSNPTIEGCVFDGKILTTGTTEGTKTTGAAGIVGYTNYQTLTIKNCLYKPAALADGETAVTDGSATLYINASGSAGTTVTCTNCYYTATLGTAQGTQGYTVSSGTTNLSLDYGSATTIYEYNGIKVYDCGLLYGDKLYTGGTTSVTFTPDAPAGYAVTNVAADHGTLTNNNNGTYTLVMDSTNVSITADIVAAVTRIINPVSNWDSASDGWTFISSPVVADGGILPTAVDGLIGNALGTTPETYDYDLYRLEPSTTMWENYNNADHHDGFKLVNGKGYLYARRDGTTLVFAGTFNNESTKTVGLSPGWNLVGNPFTEEAYVSKPYYTLDETGSVIVATPVEGTAIPPCHGIIVQATSENDSVVFTKATQQSAAPSNGGLNIALTQANTRGVSTGSTTLALDNAIITFNEGCQLGKFYFGKQNANIYIPQGNQDYAIAFSEGQGEMPLNFKATKDGEYTITVNPENVEMAYLHLIDNLTGADIDLLHPETLIAGEDLQSLVPSYTFTAKTTDYESRFRLVFSVCGDADGDNAPFAFISNGNIIITGITGDACNASLQVIDVMGRIVRCRDAVPASLPTTGLVSGVYVLRLINGENSKIQKIVIQ